MNVFGVILIIASFAWAVYEVVRLVLDIKKRAKAKKEAKATEAQCAQSESVKVEEVQKIEKK